MRNFRNIRAWQEANQLVLGIYQITKTFPKDELYGLVSQLRRATISIATNIVEGSSRRTKRDFIHFLYMAYGSSNEVDYLTEIGHRLGYLNQDTYSQTSNQILKSKNILRQLIKAIEEDKKED